MKGPIPSKTRQFPGWGWRRSLQFSWLDALGDCRWKDFLQGNSVYLKILKASLQQKGLRVVFPTMQFSSILGCFVSSLESHLSVGQVLIICSAGRSPCKTLVVFQAFFCMCLPWKLVELIQFEEHILKLEKNYPSFNKHGSATCEKWTPSETSFLYDAPVRLPSVWEERYLCCKALNYN